MASRVTLLTLPSCLRRRRPLARTLNSSAASPAVYAEKPETYAASPAAAVPKACGALSLDDAEKLFSSVSTATLLRASANLHAAAIGPVVDLGTRVMASRLMEAGPVRSAVLWAVRHTFYEHFCAGEDAEAAGRTVSRLREAGIRGMLVYALEYASHNQDCDRNLSDFIRTVQSTKSLPPSSVSFIIVKITAICPMKVLERASDLLRWQHKDPSLNLPWKQKTFTIFADSSPTYHTPKRPEPLTPDEERDLQLGHERLRKLCRECAAANVPLSVDAEHTRVQPAIDYLTYASAIEHNKDGGDVPVLYGTMQAYLKDAKERLLLAAREADTMGVPIGFKVVRGAYMSSEAKLAASLGHASPVHDTIQDTHDCYNACASFMLDRIAARPGGLVLASHNVESGKLAAMKAHDLGIEKVNRRLEFAQLYGMAESLSFGLRNAGFQVSKYMPFGPVDVVMPYLLRRAEENRGLLSASTLDRQLMRKELKRRMKAAIL